MRIARSLHCQAGATAVEYGVIAGLIALGILGSLIGTRTSLNSVLGVTSTSLGQSTMSHPKQPDSANASYWASKTLVSMKSSNVTATGGSYTYTYSDGTVVSYSVSWKPDGSFNGESISISRNAGGYQPTVDSLSVNADGLATSIAKYQYYDNTSSVYTITTANGSPTDQYWSGTVNYYLRNGEFSNRCSSGQCCSPAISTRASAAQDPLYFRGLVAQM